MSLSKETVAEFVIQYNASLDTALKSVETTLAGVAAAQNITPVVVEPPSVCLVFFFSHISHMNTNTVLIALESTTKNIQTSGEIKRQRDAIIARLQSVNETLLLLQQKLTEQEQQKQQEEEDESSSGSDSGSESGSESESDGELPDTDSAEAVARTLALVHEAEQLLREQESRGRSASPVPPRARGRANSLRSLFTNPPPRPDTGSSTPGSPTPRKAPSPSPTARH